MDKNIPAGRRISSLSNQIRRRLDAMNSPDGISGSQGRILHFILAQTQDIFQKDIEQEFVLRPSSATQILKLMEKNGLIRRETTARDARLKKIIATEKAIAHRHEVVASLEEMERDLVQDIPPEMLEIFSQVVEQMTKNLKD